MNNKLLGAMAMLGAPFLFIGYVVERNNPHLEDSWFTGAWGLMYITGWMCSIRVLMRSNVFTDGKFGKSLPWIILVSLTIANVSNIYQLAVPDNKPFFFFYIDLFWPLSNLIMLIVGIHIVAAHKLKGWPRFIPLIVGIWLPVSIGALILLGKNSFSMMIGGVYSIVAWTLLALLVSRLAREAI